LANLDPQQAAKAHGSAAIRRADDPDTKLKRRCGWRDVDLGIQETSVAGDLHD
jgi:hypothetical protein